MASRGNDACIAITSARLRAQDMCIAAAVRPAARLLSRAPVDRRAEARWGLRSSKGQVLDEDPVEQISGSLAVDLAESEQAHDVRVAGVELGGALERAHGVRGAAKQCWSAEGAAYGTPASAEDVAECGDCCAICQERYERPVRLGCEHVVCEECVGEWFERERTCPLCRATVASAGARSYGDGGTVMYAHVF